MSICRLNATKLTPTYGAGGVFHWISSSIPCSAEGQAALT
jgi:hypothetical protein